MVTYLKRDLSVENNTYVPRSVVLINVEFEKLSLSIRPSKREHTPNLFAVFSYREIVSTWEQSSDWAPASEMATARPRYHILNDRGNDVLLNYIPYKMPSMFLFQ